VGLNQQPRNCQAETDLAVGACGKRRSGNAPNWSGETRAVIGNVDRAQTTGFMQAYRDAAALWRVANGVVKQVNEDLQTPIPVNEGRRVSLNVNFDLLGGRTLCNCVSGRRRDRFDCLEFGLEPKTAGGPRTDVDEPFSQPLQTFGFVNDDIQITCSASWSWVCQQALRKPDDGSQWGAQLVSDRGQHCCSAFLDASHKRSATHCMTQRLERILRRLENVPSATHPDTFGCLSVAGDWFPYARKFPLHVKPQALCRHAQVHVG